MKKITMIITLVSINMFAQNLTEGLLLDYKFNGNTDDSSGNGYHGLNYRGNFVEDRLGNPFSAIVFNGIDSYVDLPNIIELKPDLPVSFSFWVRYDSEDYRDRELFNTSFEEDVSTGISFNSQISSGNYAINYGNGVYNYSPSTRQTYVSNSIIETGSWHYVVVVINSVSDMKLYVDCVENEGVYSGSGSSLQYSDTPGSIGRHDRDMNLPANYFKGALDDFRYWNRALTDDEINILCEQLSTHAIASNFNSVLIFPNPSEGILNIKSNDNNIIDKIIIFNSTGQQVLMQNFKSIVDLRGFSKGLYFIRLFNKSFVETQKIIIK